MSATAFGERLLGEVHTERLDEVRGAWNYISLILVAGNS
jgi:hypothetical protein